MSDIHELPNSPLCHVGEGMAKVLDGHTEKDDTLGGPMAKRPVLALLAERLKKKLSTPPAETASNALVDRSQGTPEPRAKRRKSGTTVSPLPSTPPTVHTAAANGMSDQNVGSLFQQLGPPFNSSGSPPQVPAAVGQLRRISSQPTSLPGATPAGQTSTGLATAAQRSTGAMRTMSLTNCGSLSSLLYGHTVTQQEYSLPLAMELTQSPLQPLSSMNGMGPHCMHTDMDLPSGLEGLGVFGSRSFDLGDGRVRQLGQLVEQQQRQLQALAGQLAEAQLLAARLQRHVPADFIRRLGVDLLAGNDHRSSEYTGLPWAQLQAFLTAYGQLGAHDLGLAPAHMWGGGQAPTALRWQDDVLLAIIRTGLGYSTGHLAYVFGTSTAQVDYVVSTRLQLLACMLHHELLHAMPALHRAVAMAHQGTLPAYHVSGTVANQTFSNFPYV